MDTEPTTTVQSPGTKSWLRTQARATRRWLSSAQRTRASFRAARNFIGCRKLASAKSVAVYLAAGSELDPEPLIDSLLRADRRVFAPKLRSQHPMHLVRLRADSRLRLGRHNIASPASHAPRALLRQLDVILLPIVAFDREGRRLGSGGGFYDRLLSSRHAVRRPLLVGYAFSVQQQGRLPEDPWDRRLDAVVTERGVIWF